MQIKDHPPGMVPRTYKIEVITPIFGGGVEAGKIDPEHPIRESSIRGHLRFWWRATRGAKYSDVRELRQREGEIWGSMENPSLVSIEISDLTHGEKYPCAYYPEGRNFLKFEADHLGYALFPFQGNKKDGTPIADCLPDIKFQLTLIFPSTVESDIKSSLWAWINFGGIGARTRRGCGALYCEDFAPAKSDNDNLIDWYKTFSEDFITNHSGEKQWPTLPKKILIRHEPQKDIKQSWAGIIELMWKFRQGKIGRTPNSPRPGRSYWPEPESIRKATNCRNLPQHPRIEEIPDNAFPRAELGLPIIFQFTPKGSGDPYDTELYPIFQSSEKTRMASPLILRPIKCINKDIINIVLQLDTPQLEEVILKKVPDKPRFNTIRGNNLASYPNSPMGAPFGKSVKRSEKGSALEAFLSFIRNENGFTEVP